MKHFDPIIILLLELYPTEFWKHCILPGSVRVGEKIELCFPYVSTGFILHVVCC